MTPQEIFDKVSVHLLTQGKRALSPKGRCMYRGEEGTMCAVGCLLDDITYQPNFEGKGVNELVETFEMPEFFVEEAPLLQDLQSCHDDYQPDEWPVVLTSIAGYSGLSTTSMDEYLKTAKGPDLESVTEAQPS